MKGGQQIQPQLMQTIPPEFLPFAKSLTEYLSGSLGQTNPYRSNVLQGFFGFGMPSAPVAPGIGQAPAAPGVTTPNVLGAFNQPGTGWTPRNRELDMETSLPFQSAQTPLGTPRFTLPTNPVGSNVPANLPAGGGFFGQGQEFLGSLLGGQIPASLRQTFAQNLAEAQTGLNAELQKRGAFYSTAAQHEQQRLSENALNNLNNLVFGNAMQAIPQGLNLFGAAGGLSGMAEQLPPGISAGTNLLSALRGTSYQPQYAPDTLTEILGGIIPFLPWGKWFG